MTGFLSEHERLSPAPVRVLVASDEPQFYSFITKMTACDRAVQIVGRSGTGPTLFVKKKALKPDLIILELGKGAEKRFEAIEKIMASDALPILVIAPETDAVLACQAISKGALEVASRSEVGIGGGDEFARKIKMLSKIKVISHIRAQAGHPQEAKQESAFRRPSAGRMIVKPHSRRQVLAIASSTGGPKALYILLSAFPVDFPCPVVVAQHMADDFIRGMAEWLDRNIPLKVKVGQAGEPIQTGTVYLSPSERHMQINPQGRIEFRDREPHDIYFPSCDILLSSIARTYKDKSIGVMLTGMGNDGVIGIRTVKEAGGVTIAQDEATSVVFGMPRAAIESGCIDKVFPLQEIAPAILSLTRKQVNS